MGHSTDIVAYTYNADIYCPPCIWQMFDGHNLPATRRWDVEDLLGVRAIAQGIDYSEPYSYDSHEFPKVVFRDQANDADYDHCGNSAEALNGRAPYADVCEVHIAHDEHGPDGCHRWRNVEVRGPDFGGHDITWTDLDGEGFTLEMHQVFSDEPAKRASTPDHIRWSYVFTDTGWQDARNRPDPHQPAIFRAEDYESTAYADEPSIVAGLLGFLNLQPGDTDSDYFDHYTERQTDWMEERAETLSLAQYDQFDGE